MKKYLFIILLFASANALAAFSPNDGATTQSSVIDEKGDAAATETNELEADKKRPRLKFKNKGPTCMCVDGLSEKDIQQQQIHKPASE